MRYVAYPAPAALMPRRSQVRQVSAIVADPTTRVSS